MRLSTRLSAVALVLLPLGALLVAREVGRTQSQGSPIAAAGAQSTPSMESAAPGEEAILGVVVPRESADLAPPVGGRVISILVGLGDKVRAGDLIATLDSRLTEADLAAAQASARSQETELEIADAAREAAEDRERRVQALAAQGLASGADLARAVQDSEQSRLRSLASSSLVAQRHAQVRRLSSERKLLEVRAPFDGTVVARYVDPGAAVSLNPLLPIVRLVSTERLMIRMAVPEARIAHARLGSRIRATTERSEAVLTGKLERFAPEIEPATRTFVAEASIDQVKGSVMAGAIVQVAPVEPSLQ